MADNMTTRFTYGALALSLLALMAPAGAEEVVNVYSYRQPALIQPLLDTFTKETGIQTRVLFDDKGLAERVAQEGATSPADVILTVDVGRLFEFKEKGLAQPVESEVLKQHIPPNLRDPENQWFGLTMRARVVYASKDRVPQNAISYEELADPKWKGKICIRSGQHLYNLGLIAAMIAHKGEAATKEWLTGLKSNLARKPSGNDRGGAKGVFAGECDLAIGNTYYVGLMATNEKEPQEKDWAKAIKVIFPSSSGMGTNVNLSGVVLAKNAPNKANAVKLMEFLASPEAQQIYAESNMEYPVDPKTPASELVRSWGELKADTVPLADIAHNIKTASKLVDEVGFDD